MSSQSATPSFGVVLPFYNEALYLPQTLDSLARQTRLPEQIVLVDNGSTDESAHIAQSFCEKLEGSTAIVVSEPTPGKVHALRAGCRLIKQQWVITCDADTLYPPHYVATAERLALQAARKTIAEQEVVALMAIGLPADDPDASRSMLEERLRLARRFPGKCFTGGFGQVFRCDVLNRVGGFNSDIWPYVLMDHEIVHRLYAHGRGVYDADFWCCPSDRRADRQAVRWNLRERWLYRNVPRALEGWFFYRYLARRFSRRGLQHLNLRQQSWRQSKKT